MSITDTATSDTTHDPRQAAQFPTRLSASAHARAIGWPSSDAAPIEVMGFRLWAIMDPHTAMLTWSGYRILLIAAGAPIDPVCPCRAHMRLRQQRQD